MSTSIKVPTPFELGERYAREGRDYNPYIGPRKRELFQLGYDCYMKRTQFYARADSTAREQRG